MTTYHCPSAHDDHDHAYNPARQLLYLCPVDEHWYYCDNPAHREAPPRSRSEAKRLGQYDYDTGEIT